jgi:hypothetical protein
VGLCAQAASMAADSTPLAETTPQDAAGSPGEWQAAEAEAEAPVDAHDTPLPHPTPAAHSSASAAAAAAAATAPADMPVDSIARAIAQGVRGAVHTR